MAVFFTGCEAKLKDQGGSGGGGGNNGNGGNNNSGTGGSTSGGGTTSNSNSGGNTETDATSSTTTETTTTEQPSSFPSDSPSSTVMTTKSPSSSPIVKVTKSPIPLPTTAPSVKPTSLPVEDPTPPPSMVPSRAHLQSITTIPQFGSSMELDSAYGYIFNIRSTTTGPAVIITGIDFVTESTARVNYELWSRLGSYESYKGTYDGWELVASGTTRGQGSSGYTSIPDAMFTPVSIPGGSDDDGTRAFYLTLNTKELVYKLGESGAAVADKQTQATSEELEVYEGESIMSYPFPDAETQSYFYRGPRQFVGVIHYDRFAVQAV
eukprot:g14891.t1 g14891   contig21:95760-96938(+)